MLVLLRKYARINCECSTRFLWQMYCLLQVLQEYEQIEKEIGKLKESIQQHTQELETTQKKMETLRAQWLEPLSKTVEKINSNFSSYFSAMSCAGEVTLEHGENPVSHHKI